MSAQPQNTTSLAQVRAANPFGANNQVAQRVGGNAAAQSDQQRAIAEVQAAMMIARMNPRDPILAMDRILNACARPTLADQAVYSYAKGGTDITGPSIRLAETMAQNWGNMQFGIRELEQSEGESTVQAYAWDVETNTRREITFQVPHVRHTKKGQYQLEDPREIYELVANQGARRLRACILAVIPGDVTEAAVNQCDMTMRTKADTSPEAIQKMLQAFEAFNVSKEQIEARIQRRVDAIQPAQIVSLKKIYASLRDGMSKAEDWFEQIDGKQVTTADFKKAASKPSDAEKATTEKRVETPASQSTQSNELTNEEKAAIAASEKAEAEANEQGQQAETTTRAARTTRARTATNIE